MNKVLTGYKITSFESDDYAIELSPNIIKKLKLNIQKTIGLKFGGLSSCANLVRIYSKELKDGDEIRISNKIFKDLRVPKSIPLSVEYTGNQEFRLGPVVGILTFRRIIDAGRFGYYLNYLRHFGNGLLYIFGSKGINPKTKTVNGYYYNQPAKVWEQCDFPYPDAVMDLCYPNAYKAHQILEKALGQGRIFNKKTLINKLDFYNALKEHNFLTRHLPETKVLSKTKDLENFLSKYPEVFLKPVNGMQGKGIMKISLQNNILECLYRLKNENIEKKLINAREVFSILQNLTSHKSQYIIQNAIPRMDYKGSPFCFRTIVCKDGSGQWVAPAIFPKATSDKGFLTNHASGARFVPLKALFSDISRKLPCTKTKFINQLVDLSLKTARALDQKHGPLGKIGIDTVVDQSGKLWLIEANGNPGPVPASHLVEFPHWSYQTFKLPMSYATYLAGFNN